MRLWPIILIISPATCYAAPGGSGGVEGVVDAITAPVCDAIDAMADAVGIGEDDGDD